MLEPLKSRIAGWRRLGCLSDQSGSEIVAHIPRDFPDAYLHAIYAPKRSKEWACYFPHLPDSLEALYWECNGLLLFMDLSVWGIRDHYVRDLSARFLPFDLITHHEQKIREIQPRERHVFFGGYGSGAVVAIGYESPKIFAYRAGKEPVAEWPDMISFLVSEFDRLDGLHDGSGYPTRSVAFRENA